MPRHIDFLNRALSELLKRGYDCGFLIIRISYSKRFVQLRKYINAPGEYGIQLAFPKAKWALPYFDDIKNICMNIDPSRCCIAGAGGMDFIYFDFGKNISMAHKCIKQILIEVFGVTINTKLFVHLEHAALWDDLVDEPNKYFDESLKTTLKRTRELIRDSKKNTKRLKKRSDKNN